MVKPGEKLGHSNQIYFLLRIFSLFVSVEYRTTLSRKFISSRDRENKNKKASKNSLCLHQPTYQLPHSTHPQQLPPATTARPTNMFQSSLRRILSTSTKNKSFASPLSSAAQGGADYGIYAGVKVPFVESLEESVVKPENTDIWPAYRLIDNNGQPVDSDKEKPHLALGISEDTLVDWYRTMLKLRAMDQIFYDAQRQGRISFYMTNSGEEATHIGSAS
jgi:hypothetical protein